MRAALWTVVFVLCACTLPEGKLSQSDEPKRESSQRRTSDGGIDASAERDAAAADAASGGSGGSVVRAPMAGQDAAGAGGVAAPPASSKPEPKPNGELCRSSEDCTTGNCKSSDNGERRCYGMLKQDQHCSEPYDCDGYSCVPLALAGKKSVCVDKAACTAKGTCFADYGIAMCQLEQHCNAQPGSFNQCFQKACALAGSSNSQCLVALPTQQSLNEAACCPSGGVFNASCNAASQCGCAENTKCTVDGVTGKPACIPVGSVPPGGSCAKPEDCTKGHGCVGNVCKQHCEGPEDTACTGGGACKSISFASAGATGAHYCTRPCDPFDTGSTAAPFVGCAEGQRCNPATDGQSDCGMTGSVEAGDSCDDGTGQPTLNACAPSSLCIQPINVCLPFCHVGEDDCESKDCRSIGTTRYFVGQTEVGFCAPP